ncbi:MAG: hypothetical protein WDN44_13405 [Sphingomonas sp.]
MAESPAFPPRPLRWLFLDLNSYFASVEQQLQPELRGRPIVVAPVDADTTVAIAASGRGQAVRHLDRHADLGGEAQVPRHHRHSRAA